MPFFTRQIHVNQSPLNDRTWSIRVPMFGLLLSILILMTSCTLLPTDGVDPSSNSAEPNMTTPVHVALPERAVAVYSAALSAAYYQSAEDYALVDITMVDSQGSTTCYLDSFTFSRGESIAMPASELENCGTGSIVVSSDKDMVAIIDLIITLADNQSEMVKRNIYSGLGDNNTTSTIYVPDLYPNADIMGASVFVQNTAKPENPFTVLLLNHDGRTVVSKSFVAAGSNSQQISIASLLKDIEQPGEGPFVAKIEGEYGLVTATIGCRANLCTAGMGLRTPSTRWFVPGWISQAQTPDPLNIYSTITVINTEEADAVVTISAEADADPLAYQIAARGNLHLSTADLPLDFGDGSTIQVESEHELLVSAQYLNFIDGRGAAYNGLALGQGGTDLFLPRAVVAESVHSVVHLQNLSDAPAGATLYFYRSGASAADEEPLQISLPPIGPWAGHPVDVNEILHEQTEAEWEGAILIESTESIGALILTQEDAESNWATGYTAMPLVVGE